VKKLPPELLEKLKILFDGKERTKQPSGHCSLNGSSDRRWGFASGSLMFVLCLVWVELAWAHGDISNLPNSVQIMQYRLLIYINPDDLKSRNMLAMALYRTNELEEAEKELIYIIERDSLNFDALDGLGIVLIKAGRYQEALHCLEKAVKINEEDVMVHVHLSVLYQKTRLPERAKSELEKARSLASQPIELENIEKELKLVRGNGR
jgi:tetratricopeptide (TPR) repeat protein